MATDAGFQDQRKRTLEALERRFAVEHLLQQKKNKKSLNKVDNKEHNSKGSSFIASVVDKTDAAVTPTLGASSKKGVFFFILFFLFYFLKPLYLTLLWRISHLLRVKRNH
jgi:ribonuclease P protein subunit POP4